MMVAVPEGFRFDRLDRTHPRRQFRCGETEVDRWLQSGAMQSQSKRLTTTTVLLDGDGAIAGYYTLATGQVDFGDLPPEIARNLPKRLLPVAVLAWLGVDQNHQRHGLGARLLAQALRDCHEAGKTFSFVAVVLDCLNERAREFYRKWDFEELPGNAFRLFLSAARLEALMTVP